MIRGNADAAIRAERLFEADLQTVLIASGDERGAGGGADGGVRVSLHELHPSSGDAVDIRRGEIAAAVAGEVGVTEIVGEDEDDVGRRAGSGSVLREQQRGGGRGGDGLAAGDVHRISDKDIAATCRRAGGAASPRLRWRDPAPPPESRPRGRARSAPAE